MVTIVTDSTSQLDNHLSNRLGVTVVPVAVVVDGVAYLERIEISDEDFYRALAAGAPVTTAAASPGHLLEAYTKAAEAGAEAIVSIHIGSEWSGTLNSARIAAHASPVPVELVDTTAVSFGIACGVWAAADQIANGGDAGAAADAARVASRGISSVFVVGSPALLRAGGRLAQAAAGTADANAVGEIAVWASDEHGLVQLEAPTDIGSAIEAMADWVRTTAGDRRIRAGVGDAWVPAIGDELAQHITERVKAPDLFRHTLSPSMASHLGAGSIQCTFTALDT